MKRSCQIEVVKIFQEISTEALLSRINNLLLHLESKAKEYADQQQVDMVEKIYHCQEGIRRASHVLFARLSDKHVVDGRRLSLRTPVLPQWSIPEKPSLLQVALDLENMVLDWKIGQHGAKCEAQKLRYEYEAEGIQMVLDTFIEEAGIEERLHSWRGLLQRFLHRLSKARTHCTQS